MRSKFLKTSSLGVLVIVPTVAAVAPLRAQTPAAAVAPTSSSLEEIVVTAQKRNENLQRTPIAITALTDKALRAAGITDIKGVAQNTPSVTISSYPSAASTLVTYIRGQGTGDPMIVTRDGSVGVYLDGFYLARPQSTAFDLADVERVEVLRGPQGTLYGRNTTGGAVNIISKKPTGEFGFDGTVDVGNFGYHREFANLNLPRFANDTIAVKVTALESHLDGFVHNSGEGIVPDANNYGLRKDLGGRVAVRWTPSSNVTVDYAGDIARSKSTPVYYVNKALVGIIPGYSTDPYRTYRPIYLPEADSKTDGQSLTVAWAPSSNLTLRSLSSYRHLNYFSYQDYAEAFFVPFLSPDHIISRSYSQEFQAIGTIPNADIKYTLGLYYFREAAGHHNGFDINPSPAYLGGTDDTLVLKDRQVDARSISYAAYGQVTWNPAFLDHRLGITVGGRFTSDKRRASRLADVVLFTAAPGTTIPQITNRKFLGPGTYFDTGAIFQSNDLSYKRFNPTVTLDYQVTPNINAYAKVATGYKAGGSTEGAPDFALTFKPESVHDYEVGVKSDLFDHHVRLNLAGFITKTRGFQIDFLTNPADPSFVQIINAGAATLKGLEADLTIRPIRALTLNASYSYIHQKLRIAAPAGTLFDPAVNPGAPTALGGDISGYFRVPFTPKSNLNINADWVIATFDHSDLSLHAIYNYRGKIYATAGSGPLAPNYQVNARPSYQTVDGRLTYRTQLSGGREVTWSLWAKNLFDKRYLADFVTANGSPLDGYTSAALPYASPRTYGIQFGFEL